MPGELLVLRRRAGRAAEPHELHFVELVHSQQPPRVLTRRPGLTTEARCVRDVAARQRGAIDDFVTQQVRQRHLRRGDQEQVVRLGAVHVCFELRELAGALHDLTPREVRRSDLGVAMLAGVEIQHEGDERARQSRAEPDEQREARPRQLRAAPEIHEPEPLGDLPVRWTALRGRLTPGAHDLVVRFVAVRDFWERQVGHVEQLRFERGLDRLEIGFQGGDPRTEVAARGGGGCRQRALLLH